MQPINESKKQKKRWYKKWWGLLLIALIVMYFGSALIVRFTTDPNAKQNPKPTSTEATTPVQTQTPKAQTPSYEIKIAGNDYADPTARRVTFTVTNTGQVEGNPACNVDVFNDVKTYTGYDYATWKTPLKPGEFKYYSELVIVTNEGATYATNVKVRCS